MLITPRDLLLGLLLPLLVSLVSFVIAAYSSRRGLANVASASGWTLAILGSYFALQLGPFQPRFDREYLPYACLIGGLVSALAGFNGKWSKLCFSISLLVGVVASGWLLVPTWEHLEPSRTVWLAIYCVVLTPTAFFCKEIVNKASSVGSTKLDGLSANRRVARRIWISSWGVAFAVAGAVIMLSGAASFAQASGIGMAAVLGILIADVFKPSDLSCRMIASATSFWLCSLLLTARINSFSHIPSACYLLLPVGPMLCSWLLPIGDSDRSRRWTGYAPAVVAALVLPITSLGMAVWAEWDSISGLAGEEY